MDKRQHATLFAFLLAGVSPSVAGARGDHDDDGRRFRHVLLISIDGMHAVDLAHWVDAHPDSALGRLSKEGVTYTAARATTPSDSFPGLVALVTGGTPRSTGVYYDDSYDRTLFPPGSACQGNPGTEVVYDETVDHDLTQLFSGGIDPVNLPLRKHRDGRCTPVYPHQFIRVNTIFEVAHAHGLRTAWSDKHPAYDVVNGPSGKGVDDLYTPEINSNIANGGVVNGVDLAGSLANCNATNALKKVSVYTDCIPSQEAYDDVKVEALLHEIHGLSADGSSHPGVPAIFGMNFQAVSVGQKLPIGGYLDAAGTPSDQLEGAIAHTDRSIGRLVDALVAQHLWRSTLVVISAKHGQSPIDRRLLAMEGASQATFQDVQDPIGFVNQVDANVDSDVFHFAGQTNGAKDYARNGHLQTDDVGILWLQNESRGNVSGIVDALRGNADAIFAGQLPSGTVFKQNITSGADLAELFGDPAVLGSLAHARAPDVFIQPDEGVIYSGSSKKIAEHGGGAPNDTGVALLVAGAGLDRAEVHKSVTTTQVAPTILRALGLDPDELDAVSLEHTRSLPGLSR